MEFDGLDGRGTEFDQRTRIAQRGVETAIAYNGQHTTPRDRHQIEFRFGEQAKRPLGTAQDRVKVEAAARIADMREIVSCQASVQLGEGCSDKIRLLAMDRVDPPMDRANTIGPALHDRKLFDGQRAGTPYRAVEHHRRQLQHMIAGLAVEAGTLAAGVGADHAADGGSVRRGKLRREEQPERGYRGIELILHHPGLDPHPAFLGIDFENAVHVPRNVDDQPVGE